MSGAAAPAPAAGAPAPARSGLLGPPPPMLHLQPPPPANTKPAVMQTAGHLRLGRHIDAMLPDVAEAIAAPLAQYQAGLQPYIAPAGTPWQQEVVFDRIARTDSDIQSQMMFYFEAARSYDARLSLERITASQYYNGLPLGDEEPGRSKLVLTTVRDTVRATMPSLLRVFTAVENPCEFTPAVADNEQLGLMHAELARQATQYANWALFVANQGWIILNDAILNALTRKAGWIRWYWGQQRSQRVEDCDRLLAPQLQALLAEPGITAQRIVRRPMLPNEARAVAATPEGAAYLQAGGPPLFYAARITRSAARAWPIVESVSPECVWTVQEAETVGGARAIFHVRDLPASDLISAGLPEAEVMKATESTPNFRQRAERIARDPLAGGIPLRGSPPNDPAMRIVRYTEGWCQMDTDGDNVAELIHVHCVGTMPRLIRWDRTDEVPLACMTPYREPGRIVGLSQADMVMDLQRTQTRVMRAVLDSLGQSIFPRTVVQVGGANIEDARQTAIGAIIRTTQPNAITELTKPFVGAQALPVLEVLDAVRESRTGITRTSQGLTAESLQSTTPTAVSAQTGASQDRLDMIARTLAETGLAPLYKGLIRLLAKHQDRPNVLSLRGKWITVDPRALSIMWEVQCNVGGKGTPAERLAMLAAIAAKQEQILAPAVQQGMLDTPLVGLPEYRNTLARMVETAGFSDVVSFFKELPPNWQPPPPPQPQPSTDQVLAQVEAAKTQASAVDDARKAHTDRAKIWLDDERGRAAQALEAWINAYATAAQYNTPLPSIAEFQAAMKSSVPPGALLIDPTATPPQIPTPGAPIQPALGVPLPPGRPGGAPPGMPMAMPAGMPQGMPAGVSRTGPVPSVPPIARPPAAPPDAATLLAMRRALMSGRGDVAGTALGNRALMPPQGGPANG